MINPVQDITLDGQPMEETTYLEHSALGVSTDSGLMEGMSRMEPLEQSVLGAWAVMLPEETNTPERPALAAQTYHEQACFTLSAWPIWDTAIVIDTDVNADINTDLPENSALMMTTDSRLLKCNTQLYPPGLLSARPILDPAIAIDTDVSADINADLPENSAPMMNTDSRLLKCNTQVYPPRRDTQGCRPMKGITEPLQVELSGLTLAIDQTNEEQLPHSISWKQSDPIITEGQDYWECTEETQFGYNTGYSSLELADAIRREVLRNRSMKYMSSREVDSQLLLPEHANMSDAEISLDQVRLEGLRQWNMDMDIEYQYEAFNGVLRWRYV